MATTTPGEYRQRVPRPPGAIRLQEDDDSLTRLARTGELTLAAVERAFPAEGAVVPDTGAPSLRDAAVLVGLVDRPGEPLAVVLIRRSEALRANPGEIAFPGGRIDLGETPLEAAVREAEEEVSLARDLVRPIGSMAPLRRAAHNDAIVPIVGEIDASAVLVANPAEVADVVTVALVDLVAPGAHWQERWDPAGRPAWTMQFFDLGADVVWGATGRLLASFLLRVLGRPELPSFA